MINFRTAVAAAAIAAAPMKSTAQTVTQNFVKDGQKVERTITKVANGYKTVEVSGDKNATHCTRIWTSKRMPKEPGEDGIKGKLQLNAGYSTKDILGLRTNEPMATIKYNGASDHVYFRPSVSLGSTSYEAAIPMGLKTDIGKNVSVEGGADLARLRGFYNKEALTQSEANKVLTGADCQAMPYKAEFNQNLHAGLRYQNDVVNASIRGEVGRNVYLGRTRGLVGDGKGVTAEELAKTDIPIVKDQKSTYVGARAGVEVTPLKNKNISINAEGMVSSNKSPEATVGVGFKF